MECYITSIKSYRAFIDPDKLKEFQSYIKDNFPNSDFCNLEFEFHTNNYLAFVRNDFIEEDDENIMKFINKLQTILVDGFIYVYYVDKGTSQSEFCYMITPQEIVELIPVFVREKLKNLIEEINRCLDKFDLKKKEDNNGIHVNNKD
jgi:hypothetical protein